MHVNTVLNPAKNLGGEFIRCNIGNLLLSGKVAVDTTHNKSSRVPKGKRRNVGKSMATRNCFNEVLRDMQVICRHPLSHLDRRIVRLYTTYRRLNRTFWVKIWSDLPLWCRRGNLKALGTGLQEGRKRKSKERRWLKGWEFWASVIREGIRLPFIPERRAKGKYKGKEDKSTIERTKKYIY